MRIVLSIIGILLLIVGLFVLSEEPERTAVKAPEPAKVSKSVEPAPPTVPKVKAPEAAKPVDDASTQREMPDAAAIQDAEPDESGLYELSLGTHRVQLKGETGVFLVAEVVIRTASATARDNARRLRNKLVGMYFFLVSRRVDESLMSDAGIERLEADLLQRFSNTIRGGDLEVVELLNHAIEDPEEE